MKNQASADSDSTFTFAEAVIGVRVAKILSALFFGSIL
ncbi:MAG: hypothetical protein ACJAU1_000751 [Psychromonas sp.]|jgi:hypothetical protein